MCPGVVDAPYCQPAVPPFVPRSMYLRGGRGEELRVGLVTGNAAELGGETKGCANIAEVGERSYRQIQKMEQPGYDSSGRL